MERVSHLYWKQSWGWRLTDRIGEVLCLRIYCFGVLYTSYTYCTWSFRAWWGFKHMVRHPLTLLVRLNSWYEVGLQLVCIFDILADRETDVTETESQRFLYLILDLVSIIVLWWTMGLIGSTSGNFSPVSLQPLPLPWFVFSWPSNAVLLTR